MCVSVHVCQYVCMCVSVYVCAHVCRREVDVEYVPRSPSTLFLGTKSLPGPGAPDWASWPEIPSVPPVFSPPVRSSGHTPVQLVFTCALASESDPHLYSQLSTTEPAP